MNRRLRVSLSLTIAYGFAHAQTYTIQTAVGGGGFPTITYVAPNFYTPSNPYKFDVASVAADTQGGVYLAIPTYNVVARLDRFGGFSVVAGNGSAGFSGDNGPATLASLNGPAGLAVDSTGNLYIADVYNNRIREISNGIITTIAGSGAQGSGGDGGPAANAGFNDPTFVAIGRDGSVYIADTGNSRIRKIAGGVITTVAGKTPGYGGDGGAATSAQLRAPTGIALDSNGALFISDTGNNVVRKVSNGIISTVAGGGAAYTYGDNVPATTAALNAPLGLAVDNFGNLYVADSKTNRIRRIANGVITTVAGTVTAGTFGDNGPATKADLTAPAGVSIDGWGNFYIADEGNYRLRKVSNGVMTTLAGTGGPWTGGGNGQGVNAMLAAPFGVALDADGNLYVADEFGGPKRTDGFAWKVSKGVITPLAGGGTVFADGIPATSANLPYISGIAVDAAGGVFISSPAGNRVYRVANGIITTVVGQPGAFDQDNVPAINASLSDPRGLALDAAGNLYIADHSHGRVRKVSNGVITTVAGNGKSGFSGDGGPATGAGVPVPLAIAVDRAGNLYILEGDDRVRKVSNGIITTVAGNGTGGFSGDGGPATMASFTESGSSGIAVDASGNLYISDFDNYRVRKVSNGIITTIAGNGTPGFAGDNGPATSASLGGPSALAIDAAGRIYVGDQGNGRIRVLIPDTAPCSFTLSPGSIQPPAAGGLLAFNIDTGPSCSWMISGLPDWLTASPAAGTGPGPITLNATANPGPARTASVTIADQSLLVTQPDPSTALPVITSVTTASGPPGFAQGTWIEIKGMNLAPADTPGGGVFWSDSPDFAGGRMPTQLGPITVTVDGKPAYIWWYCSATTTSFCVTDQINALVPLDTTLGPVPVVVTSGAVSSPPWTGSMQTASPAFLVLDAANHVLATHSDFSVIGPATLNPGSTTPARAGETILLFGVGFGLPSTPLVDGSTSQSGFLPKPLPVCTIGIGQAEVAGAALISPGLYQLNVVVPGNSTSGDQPVVCTYAGVNTPTSGLVTIQ